MSQQRNARYKGRRLVEPRQDSSKYVVIDEVILPTILDVTYSGSDYNQVLTYEPKFTATPFLNTSPLMAAFDANFQEFRCRSVEITFESTECGLEHPRIQSAIYWVPNHYNWDNNGAEEKSQYWSQVLEKEHMQMVHKSGGKDIFYLHYVPQLVFQDDVDEDEDEPHPDTIFQVRGDFKSGWMPTGAPYTTIEFRGPVIYFRRPYRQPVPDPAIAARYQVTIRALWEFRNCNVDA